MSNLKVFLAAAAMLSEMPAYKDAQRAWNALEGNSGKKYHGDNTPAYAVKDMPKVPGRNELCACGSKKKYKKCCGR